MWFPDTTLAVTEGMVEIQHTLAKRALSFSSFSFSCKVGARP
jgi:hypothetical protein